MDCDCNEDNKTKLTICCSGCCVFSFIIFIAMCWGTIEPTYYGLICNSLSKTCNKDDVYEAGRHLIGPLNYFI